MTPQKLCINLLLNVKKTTAVIDATCAVAKEEAENSALFMIQTLNFYNISAVL